MEYPQHPKYQKDKRNASTNAGGWQTQTEQG